MWFRLETTPITYHGGSGKFQGDEEGGWVGCGPEKSRSEVLIGFINFQCQLESPVMTVEKLLLPKSFLRRSIS